MLRTGAILLASIFFFFFCSAPTARAQSIALDKGFRNEVRIDSASGDTIQTFYYPNGKKRSEGQLSRNLRNGDWTIWYNNGRIWMLGAYNYGQMDGRWKYWGDGLNMDTYTEEGQLLKGAKNGHWKYFYPNTNLESEGDWNMDLRTGTWKFWYPGNQLKRVENWANGVKDGLWQFWHINGQKEREEHYNGGVKHGTWTFWYKNGNLERKESWQGGRMHGLWTFWYPSGQIEMQGTFINGNAAGEWTVWYPNGEKKMEGDLQADTQQDVWTYWYQNSKKKALVTYNKGDIIGVRILSKPPVNYDRRPEIISGANPVGNYKRESISKNAPTMTVPQGAGAPQQALQGVNQPVTVPNSQPAQNAGSGYQPVGTPNQDSGFKPSTSPATPSQPAVPPVK